jgi:hypothetical protein
MGRAKNAAAAEASATAVAADGAAASSSSSSSGAAEKGEEPTVKIETGEEEMAPPRGGVVADRLAGPARFALAVVLSFALSGLGRSLVARCTRDEGARLRREPGGGDARIEMLAPVAWRLYVFFFVCFFGGGLLVRKMQTY